MSPLRHVLKRTAAMGGIDTRRARATLRLLPGYVRSYRAFRRASERLGPEAVALGEPFPIVADRADQAGDAGDYFLQDVWAARKVFRANPARHVDVGSRVDGFVAHLLTFRTVEVIDIRPLDSPIDGLTFTRADATTLASIPDASVESLSSLHAVEHFGLGRYGDPLDPLACFTAMRNLARVLAPGGRLYFSVPIGRERVEFNAHRILDPVRVLDTFGSLELADFAVIEGGSLHLAADPAEHRTGDEATGLFELRRPAANASTT